MASYELIEASDSLTMARLNGKLDIEGMAAIESQLKTDFLDRGKPGLVDMSWVSFIGSDGIGTLAILARKLRPDGIGMVLLNPSPPVARTFQMSGVTAFLPIARNREEALRLLGIS